MDNENTTNELVDTSTTGGSYISEKDKENFFKSVIGDIPFKETISFFGGRMTMTLQTMTVSQNSDIVQQINNDKDQGLAENNDAYFITIAMYRLAVCLVDIDEKQFSDIDKATFKESTEGVTYIRARSELMREWPTFKLSAMLDAFNEFESKVVKLTKEVKTENFWTASA